MNRTSLLQIRTPEGVVFSQHLAGPMARFLAWALDFVCVMLMASLLMAILALLQVIGAGLVQGLILLVQFALMLGYSIYCEWFWRGQTLGKRVLRLRVVDAEGLRLTFSQVVVRNLLRFADMLPGLYLVGGLACLFSRRAQRLGDLAANTLVVRIPRLTEPDFDRLLSGKYNSFRDHPHLEARLRQRVVPAEAAVALQAIVRRDRLESSARLELFASIAAHFRTKVAFPMTAIEGLPDEQYVRNVVDSLYRPASASAAKSRSPAGVPAAIATQTSPTSLRSPPSRELPG